MRIRTRWPLQVALSLPPFAVGAFMVRDYFRDHGPTGLPGDLPNWHNQPGALPFCVVLVIIECVVAYHFARHSAHLPVWRRALSASLAFAPPTALSALTLIHAGGIGLIHFFWLLALLIASIAIMIITGLRALLQSIKPRSARSV